MNEFDLVSPAYDFLKKLVFRNHLDHAEISHLGNIESDSKILILGGGTGKILTHLSGKSITYLDSSKAMIRKAQRRGHDNEVDFIHADFLEHHTETRFDLVIATCFLDVFTSQKLPIVIERIYDCLKDNGKLIVTDFRDIPNVWWKFLSWTMHTFFRLFAGLKNNSLQPIETIIEEHGFECLDKKEFHNRFIFSNFYIRK